MDLKAPPLILLLGNSGSGKSSFINSVTGAEIAPVGHDLYSLTVSVEQYTHTFAEGARVCLVDTPGFSEYNDEGSQSDLQILKMIAEFLKTEHDANRKFTGVVYLHSINGHRVSRMARRNMKIFKEICGSNSMKNVVVITTFWDQLSDIQEGVAKEEQLKIEEGLLKELHDAGAEFLRTGHFEPGEMPHDASIQTPEQILSHVLSRDPVFLEIQKEMAQGASVAETTAGSTLIQEMEELQREFKQRIEAMSSEISMLKDVNDEERSHRKEIEMAAAKLRSQVEEQQRRMQLRESKIPEQNLDPVSLERQQSQDIEELRQQLNQRLRIEDLTAEISLLSSDDEEERNHRKELEEEAEGLRRRVEEWEQQQQQLGNMQERNSKLVTKEILDAWSSQYRESMNAFQARLLSATSVQKEASSNAQVSLELETLRSRYTHIEEQNSDLKRENDQHQVHKLQLELELARLEQMAAGEGEDGVTIKVEHVATELNVSTTNIVTESTEDHAGSILRNTREANISKSNINAAREIYNVTMSGDTHMLQGKVLELSDEVKKMNEEREQLQKQIITLQEAAEDRSRRKDIFLAPSQNNKFQDLQSQGMSRREKILRKLLCLS